MQSLYRRREARLETHPQGKLPLHRSPLPNSTVNVGGLKGGERPWLASASREVG
jgi:hypothetical protein